MLRKGIPIPTRHADPLSIFPHEKDARSDADGFLNVRDDALFQK